MFQKLLSLLKSGKTYSHEALARELDISLDTLEEWLDYLAAHGSLKQVDWQQGADCHANGHSHCAGCNGCSGCHVSDNGPVLWELTDSK